jgi:protease-4
MKTKHIIIIAAVIVVVIGIIFGVSMRGQVYAGDIGVVEINNIIMSSKDVIEDIELFEDNPSVRAIILRINSPGGAAAPSQEIYDIVKRAREKKPIVTSMESVAASGAYYISLPSNVIVANPGTITGSIGVIMEWPVLEKLFEKIGVEFEVIKSKAHKDMGSTHRRLDPQEKELMQELVGDVHSQFVKVTVEHRDLPMDTVLKYADGRVFTGQQAKKLGLIDTLGSFRVAVEIAGDLCGIEDPHVFYAPRRFRLIDVFTAPMERLLLPKLYFRWP